MAAAILVAAERPQRDVDVGGAGMLLTMAQRVSPALLALQGSWVFRQQRTDEPDDGRDNLFAPLPGTGSATGGFGPRGQSVSLYTTVLGLHPNRERAVVAAALMGAAALARRLGR